MSPQTVQKRVPIVKVDEEEQVVTGPVLIPDQEDRHGDVVREENIETVAWKFMEDYQNVDLMHTFEEVGVPVGSLPLPGDLHLDPEGLPGGEPDVSFEEDVIPKGTWLFQVRVTKDEVWKGVMDGDYTGFSIYGQGERRSLEEAADD
jgi:hypothetical protein